jgi:hypothetical protein
LRPGRSQRKTVRSKSQRTDPRFQEAEMSQATGARSAPQKEVSEIAPKEPTAEQIRQRAYEIYLSRSGAAGDELQDWLQAERELRLK